MDKLHTFYFTKGKKDCRDYFISRPYGRRFKYGRLNYRIIVSPDKQTGTGKPGFTALCPTLGVADDGNTIDEALANVRGAIKVYVDSLVDDKQPVPIDDPEHNVVTTTQIDAPSRFQFT